MPGPRHIGAGLPTLYSCSGFFAFFRYTGQTSGASVSWFVCVLALLIRRCERAIQALIDLDQSADKEGEWLGASCRLSGRGLSTTE
jgi:hypothetical protein